MPNTCAFLLVAAAIASAGCASDPAENVAGNGDATCARETPVGTHFSVTKCRTQEQIARDKADADRVKSDIQQTTTFRPAGQ
jgi:hypothetical protein